MCTDAVQGKNQILIRAWFRYVLNTCMCTDAVQGKNQILIRASQQFSSTRALQKIGATLNRFDFQGVCDEETFDTDMYWECVIRYY
jgi:hypothetical protein